MRRRLLLGSAAVLVGLGVFVLDRQLARVDRTWRSMVAATERARDELEALPTERPVLWGEARAGNAEEDYQRALARFAAVPDATDLVIKWRVASSKTDPTAATEARERLTDALAPALEALREGAHRTHYARRPEWSRGHSAHTLNLVADRDLANAAIASAERLALDGQGLEAARRLLDAAQFARDRLQGMQLVDEMVGVALLAITTKGALYDQGLAKQLDPAQLRLVADGLARLDQGLDRGLGLQGDAVLTGMHALSHPDAWAEQFEYGALSAWREGFSTRLAVAELALAKLEFSAQHRDFAGLPHAERDPLESTARDRFLSRAGPLGAEETRNFPAIRSRNESLALLRMSRMMLAYQLGEEPEPLPDPFGDELHTETRPDGSFRIWSDRPGRRPGELVLDAEAPASSPR